MKGFGVILSAVVFAFILAVPVVSLSGCKRSAEGAGNVGWTTSLSGRGGEITGATVGFARTNTDQHGLTQTYTDDAGVEQLEKGNEAKVAAQVTARAQADAVRLSYGDVAAVSCPGGVCAPVVLPTPSPSVAAQEERSRSGAGAWYNGFLP